MATSQRSQREEVSALVIPLWVLAGGAVLVLLYFGRAVLLPLAFALLISLALRPIVRGGLKLRIPAPAAALVIVLSLCGAFGYGLYLLAEPAGNWLRELPRALNTLQHQSSGLRSPVDDVRAASEALDSLRSSNRRPAPRVVMEEESVEQSVVVITGSLLAQCTTAFVALFFILGWGDRVFRRAVELVPSFSERRGALQVAQAVEDAIARYLLTITTLNTCLGLATAGIAYWQGLPNPLLWGVVAGLLNFAPYVGPAVTVMVLFGVALVTPTVENPFVAPLVFLVTTSIEGYLISPFAVGRSLLLNPLVVFVSLLVCFSVWGVIGSLVAVPLLVSTKVLLEGMGESGHPAARVIG